MFCSDTLILPLSLSLSLSQISTSKNKNFIDALENLRKVSKV